MNAGRQGLLVGMVVAAMLASAAGGAEIKLSLSYAGSLAADGVTSISSALDPLSGLPAVNLPGSYHQFDIFMELAGMAADEDFQTLIFSVALGSGVTPADIGGWIPNSPLVDLGRLSPRSVFSESTDAGANQNDLQNIVIIARGAAGVAALQPGESAPFRLGSALVQWDGSPSEQTSLIGLGSQATIKNPWSVFQGDKGQALPSSTLTIDPAYDWKSHFPEPVIETPPTPQPVETTPPAVEPDLPSSILPPAVEDPFDPPSVISDPQPPIHEPDGPEPPQIQPPTFDPPPSIIDVQPPVSEPDGPELPQIEPLPDAPSDGDFKVLPYPIDETDIGQAVWVPGEWLTVYRRFDLTDTPLLGAVITNFEDGATRVNDDMPTDEELFRFALPVAGYYPQARTQLAGTSGYALIGLFGQDAQFGDGQLGVPEPSTALLAGLALLTLPSLTRRRAA